MVSKFQVPSSNGFGFMVCGIIGGKGSVTRSVNQLITKVFVEQQRLPPGLLMINSSLPKSLILIPQAMNSALNINNQRTLHWVC